MATGSERFFRQQLDKAARETPDLPTGVVTSVSPFTVSFRGSLLTAPDIRRLAVYSPSNGDPFGRQVARPRAVGLDARAESVPPLDRAYQ
jgi:hypothetical protein